MPPGAGHVGVGVQSEPGGEVPQHAGHRLDVHPILEGQGGEGVAEVMEPHFGQSRPLQYPVELMQDAVRGDGAAVG